MGTRNLTAVVKDGEYKVAQYGQWDGYLQGSGLDILNFLHCINISKFSEAVDALRFYTKDELEDIYQLYTDNGSIISGSLNEQLWKTTPALKVISRDMGSSVLWEIMKQGGDLKLKDESSFAKDSLFCEGCYVIDLDTNMYEVYEGFNKEPNTEGRFIGKVEDNGYAPVKLLGMYQLNNLPTAEEFIKQLEPLTIYYEEDED